MTKADEKGYAQYPTCNTPFGDDNWAFREAYVKGYVQAVNDIEEMMTGMLTHGQENVVQYARAHNDEQFRFWDGFSLCAASTIEDLKDYKATEMFQTVKDSDPFDLEGEDEEEMLASFLEEESDEDETAGADNE